MKNIFKYLLLGVFGVAISACEDESTKRIPDLIEGPNVRISVDPAFGFIDFSDLENAKLRYDLFSNGIAIEIINLEMKYYKSGILTDSSIIRSYVPSDIPAKGLLDEDITALDLMESIGYTLDSIDGGDSFVFTNRVTMTDGRVYPGPAVVVDNVTIDNVTPSLVSAAATASYSIQFTAFAGCPSNPEDFEGNYTSVITDSNYGAFIGSTNDDVQIVFTGPEPFRYTISDISSLAYVAFGGEAYPGDMYDICGDPFMLTTSTFGTTFDTGGGTWDNTNKVLTLNVFESNNGLSWTVEFTLNP